MVTISYNLMPVENLMLKAYKQKLILSFDSTITPNFLPHVEDPLEGA